MEIKIRDIGQLVALYLSLQPMPTSLINSVISDASSRGEMIAQLLTNPHLDTYPPAPEYQRRIWKSIVTALEDNELVSRCYTHPRTTATLYIQEVDDKIYAHFIQLISTPFRWVAYSIHD
jgi:hypothetical protein